MAAAIDNPPRDKTASARAATVESTYPRNIVVTAVAGRRKSSG
jgi:hypothetical protein